MKRTVILLCALILIACSYVVAAAAPPDKDVIVKNTSANPVPIRGNVAITGTPNVNVTNTVPTTVVNTPANPVPVTMERTLVNDGMYFDLIYTGSGTQTAHLEVPAGVVLTDAYVTFSAPETIPNAASLIIASGGKQYFTQIVNNTTFSAGISLHSGIMSDGFMWVNIVCNNIDGNECKGTLMWSGYRP